MRINREFSIVNKVGIFKIRLKQENYGVAVFVYRSKNSKFPELDYLDDSFDDAKARCFEDYGTPLNSWEVEM